MSIRIKPHPAFHAVDEHEQGFTDRAGTWKTDPFFGSNPPCRAAEVAHSQPLGTLENGLPWVRASTPATRDSYRDSHHPTLVREVALKVPHPAVIDSLEMVERFTREAKATVRLSPRHIVPVFETGTDGDVRYIVAAFIEGQPLSSRIEDSSSKATRISSDRRVEADTK